MMDVDPVQEFHRAAEQGDLDYVGSIIKAGQFVQSIMVFCLIILYYYVIWGT